jgi:hypothetical protein
VKFNPRMVAAKCQKCGLVDTFCYSYSSGLRIKRKHRTTAWAKGLQ